eukprot:322892_1
MSELEEVKDAIVPTFKLTWRHIINCVQHRMYAKLASMLQVIVSTNEFAIYDCSDKTVQTLLNILQEKKRMSHDESNYLSQIIEEARLFNPDKALETVNNNDINNQDIHNMFPDLSVQLLQDIYDVH